MGIYVGALGLGTTISCSVLMVISWWLVFEKMGEHGWKCLIPFYGRYVLFQNVWEAKAYFVSLFVNALSVLLTGYEVLHIYLLSSADTLGGDAILLGSLGLLLLVGFFSVISFAIQMMVNWRMTKCFRRGIGFFLGVTFLPGIFIPILALGDSEYCYY